MDGNFIDNDFEGIIEAAALKPEDYTDASDKKGIGALLNKYDKFALRIKFSQGLDPNSVNSGNATVLSGNKKIKTSVEYDRKRRSIIISPKSNYLRNTMYLLKLSGKVMSEKGRSLRENRFFVFRQDGKRLDFYRSFPDNSVQFAPDTLHVRRSVFLPVFFTVSSLVIILSYFYDYKLGIAFGAVLVLLATLAAFVDSISDMGKSNREYVYGAKLYNNGFFFEAVECFELALHYNPGNVYAQAGLDAAIIKWSDPD